MISCSINCEPSVGDMKLMQFGQRVLGDTKEVANCLDDIGSQAGSKKRSPSERDTRVARNSVDTRCEGSALPSRGVYSKSCMTHLFCAFVCLAGNRDYFQSEVAKLSSNVIIYYAVKIQVQRLIVASKRNLL